jgi:hypothetical protein
MRRILGILLLVGIAAWFKFGNSVVDVDYKVKSASGDDATLLANKVITYHVPGVIRMAGADIYRPEGHFTQAVVRLPKEGAACTVGSIVKAMTVGLPTKLDARQAKLLGLQPEFSFWEEHGKWFLLGGLICLLAFLFWR